MGSSEAEETGTGSSGRRPIQPPKPGTAMSIFVLLVGLGMLSVGGYSYVAESASLGNNVAVTAEITDLDVEAVPGSRGRTQYVPTPTYEYRLEGTVYTSERLYPGTSQPRYDERAAAAERLSAYAVGDRVTAYVDPEAPMDAYLEDSRSGQSVGAFAVGIGVCILGGIGLYQARREARARELSE